MPCSAKPGGTGASERFSDFYPALRYCLGGTSGSFQGAKCVAVNHCGALRYAGEDGHPVLIKIGNRQDAGT